jgi:hypothetical protein
MSVLIAHGHGPIRPFLIVAFEHQLLRNSASVRAASMPVYAIEIVVLLSIAQLCFLKPATPASLTYRLHQWGSKRSAPLSLHPIQCFLASVHPYLRNIKSLLFLMAKNTPTWAVSLAMAQTVQQHSGPQAFVSVGFSTAPHPPNFR